MPKRTQPKGTCQYCGAVVAKNAMTKHLAVCQEHQLMINKANRKSNKSQTLYHLRVQDAWAKEFWLDLEMQASATLGDLDHYLRAIWLECCGHMSQFSFGGWSGEEIPMSRKIDKVLEPGAELTHIYDFGTSSQTHIKLIGIREGAPATAHPIALMARNLMPEVACQECDQPATWMCTECQIEEDRPGLLCDQHAENHPHDDYGEPIALVNSPRLGMCGYEGPAEPPY